MKRYINSSLTNFNFVYLFDIILVKFEMKYKD